MANEVDISERWLINTCPKAFASLLVDHTTGQNIYWATDSYSNRGEGYNYFDPITVDKIKDDDVIVPRVRKSTDEQSRRVKDKAEVFTPSWICNAQNNLIDEAWFGTPELFNREITTSDGTHSWEPTGLFVELFSSPNIRQGRSWKSYITDTRLEITCGEAPYLMSRYDAVSGEEIPTNKRIGILDRKLQVINAFEHNPRKWMRRVTDAVKATYGFEWQGDSLLLAREAMLLTVLDYFYAKYPDERPEPSDTTHLIRGNIIKRQSFTMFINKIAYIISWNLWQMDGLKFVLPATSNRVFADTDQGSLFGPTPESVKESAPDILHALRSGHTSPCPDGIPAVVRDWNHRPDEPEKIFFASLLANTPN